MKKKKINSNNLLLLITIVLFFVMYAAGCIVYADKGFTRFQTFLNILINNAGLICITAGMTCVMLTGGIDISVGSLVAMDCMILAVGIEQWGWSSPVLMLLILAIGIIFGIVQGFCISYLEIQPFIVTLRNWRLRRRSGITDGRPPMGGRRFRITVRSGKEE